MNPRALAPILAVTLLVGAAYPTPLPATAPIPALSRVQARTGAGTKAALKKKKKPAVPRATAGKRATASRPPALPAPAAAPASKGPAVYDLGALSVSGVDRSRLEDGGRRKTEFLTGIDGEPAQASRERLGPIVKRGRPSSDLAWDVRGLAGTFGTVRSSVRYACEEGGGSTHAGLEYEGMDGYRFKNDYRDASFSYGYQGDADGGRTLDLALDLRDFDGYLAGPEPAIQNFARRIDRGGKVRVSLADKPGEIHGFKVGAELESMSKTARLDGLGVASDGSLSRAFLSLDYDNRYAREWPIGLSVSAEGDSLDLGAAGTSRRNTVSAEVRAEHHASDRALLSAAAGLSRTDGDGTHGTARVGATLRPSDSETVKIEAYQKATPYRYAEIWPVRQFVWLRDLFNQNRFVGTTPPVRFERGLTGSVEGKLGENTKGRAEVTYANVDKHLYFDDFSAVDPREVAMFDPGDATILRTRIDVSYRLDPLETLDFSLVHNAATDSTGKAFPYTPEIESRLAATRKMGRLTLGAAERFVGVREAGSVGGGRLGSYYLTDVNLSGDVGRNLTLEGGIENLWNKRYENRLNHPERGRLTYGGLRYAF